MAYGGVSLQDTGGTVELRPDGTYNITVPEENYAEMTITFRREGGSVLCLLGIYFEVRERQLLLGEKTDSLCKTAVL